MDRLALSGLLMKSTKHRQLASSQLSRYLHVCQRTSSYITTDRTFNQDRKHVSAGRNLHSCTCRKHAESSRILKQEVRAFRNLLQRSGFPNETIAVISKSMRRFNSSGGKKKADEDRENDGPPNPPLPHLFIMAMFTTMFMMLMSLKMGGNAGGLSWSAFKDKYLVTGQVKSVSLGYQNQDKRLVRVSLDNVPLHDVLRDDPHFVQKLFLFEQEMGIKASDRIPVKDMHSQYNNYLFGMVVMFGLTALFVRTVMTMKITKGLNKGPKLFDIINKTESFLRSARVKPADKSVKFSSIAGLREAKVEILEFVDYVKKPEKFETLGAYLPRGALLLGPPGCGKTLLAKALATEADVPFFALSGPDLRPKYAGQGAARVRSVFDEAKELAPCIIYIDEIDTIGSKRSTGRGMGEPAGMNQTLNQLLVEMDGMQSKKGVLLLASTNRSEVLDPALLRAGRFDRHIMIDYPTLVDRVELFELYLKDIKLELPVSAYAVKMAQQTAGNTGADIANICNEAAILAARNKQKAVTMKDLDYAHEKSIAGSAKKTQTMDRSELKIIAYHEAGHALIGWLLQHTDALLKVTIVPRTSAALGFAQYNPNDNVLYSKEMIYDRMCMTLGGRAAESLMFNSITNGASDDLRKVTQMAYASVKTLGMNDVVGQVSFPNEEVSVFGSKPYSKMLGDIIDLESQKLTASAYRTTEKLLVENKALLVKLAESLLEKETLLYADVENLLGPPKYGNKKAVDMDSIFDQLRS